MNRLIVGLILLGGFSLSACQREATPPAAVAPVAVAPAPEPAAVPAAPAEAGPVDYPSLCRRVEGAWNELGQACEVTSAMCPRVGSWIDGSGCKTAATEAECKTTGLQFDAKVGCLIRSIPAGFMKPADFRKE